MSLAREVRSALAIGMSARCPSFAPTKRFADPFGQAATHAPQPMQAARSRADSAVSCPCGVVSASGALPVGSWTYAPASSTRSSAERSTTRSRITGNAAARSGSILRVAPSGYGVSRWWQDGVFSAGPWG